MTETGHWFFSGQCCMTMILDNPMAKECCPIVVTLSWFCGFLHKNPMIIKIIRSVKRLVGSR